MWIIFLLCNNMLQNDCAFVIGINHSDVDPVALQVRLVSTCSAEWERRVCELNNLFVSRSGCGSFCRHPHGVQGCVLTISLLISKLLLGEWFAWDGLIFVRIWVGVLEINNRCCVILISRSSSVGAIGGPVLSWLAFNFGTDGSHGLLTRSRLAIQILGPLSCNWLTILAHLFRGFHFLYLERLKFLDLSWLDNKHVIQASLVIVEPSSDQDIVFRSSGRCTERDDERCLAPRNHRCFDELPLGVRVGLFRRVQVLNTQNLFTLLVGAREAEK